MIASCTGECIYLGFAPKPEPVGIYFDSPSREHEKIMEIFHTLSPMLLARPGSWSGNVLMGPLANTASESNSPAIFPTGKSSSLVTLVLLNPLMPLYTHPRTALELSQRWEAVEPCTYDQAIQWNPPKINTNASASFQDQRRKLGFSIEH